MWSKSRNERGDMDSVTTVSTKTAVKRVPQIYRQCWMILIAEVENMGCPLVTRSWVLKRAAEIEKKVRKSAPYKVEPESTTTLNG